MTRFITLFFLLAAVGAAGRTVLVDSEGEPVIGAAVFNPAGRLQCITTADGAFTASSLPVKINALGYEETIIETPTDTVVLASRSYELPEMSVSTKGRPVRRLVCYVRENTTFTSSADTIHMYADYMCDFFTARQKAKGFKNGSSAYERNTRYYMRNDIADSSESEITPENVTWLQIASVYEWNYDEQTLLPDSASTIDSLISKRGMLARMVHRYPESVILQDDYLANKKGHHWEPWIFKMFGITMDITEMWTSTRFRRNESGKLTLDNLEAMTMSMCITGKGKLLRKAFKSDTNIDMTAYLEIYPVDCEFLTVEEAREMRDSRYVIPFKIPETVPAIDSAISTELDNKYPQK